MLLAYFRSYLGAISHSRTLAINHGGWDVIQQPSCHLIMILDPSINLLLLYPLTALLGGGGGGAEPIPVAGVVFVNNPPPPIFP